MPNPSRALLTLLIAFTLHPAAHSQICLGGGFGTFNVPGASMRFRGTGPTFRFEYEKPDSRVSWFLDVSYFEKSVDGGTTQVYDYNGVPVGSASVTDKYSYIYNTLGFKTKFSDRKFSPYIGGGAAIVFAKIKPTLQPTYDVRAEALNRVTGGFHFNAGVQYDTGPVLFELQGNLDIILKVLVDDVSNIMTNARLTAVVPLSH